MTLLTDKEVDRLEKKHQVGISSRAVVEAFQSKGARFSEATLRKYVQLGLLPKSQRVGTRGRHRGSSGLYPVMIVRLVNDIKAALDAGSTLDEVRIGRVGLEGETDTLRISGERSFARFFEAAETHPDKTLRVTLRREVEEHRRAFDSVTRDLERFAARLARRPARHVIVAREEREARA
jgi:DNA-binding transcriptional MerR regulator